MSDPSPVPSYQESMAASLTAKNERLSQALIAARNQLKELRDQLDQMSAPPGSYGVLMDVLSDGSARVLANGRQLHLAIRPGLAAGLLQAGETLLLSDSMVVVQSMGYEDAGELAVVKELLSGGRVLVAGNNGDERVLRLSGKLSHLTADIRPGDELRIDSRSNFAIERVERSHVEDLVLDEVPDVDYSRIGGLSEQIEHIRDAVELPFAHPELYAEHKLRPPKGVLLYGPPGCGKTLIAKAVAHSLAEAARQKSGEGSARSYFLNIKGPELLNKYVGETERYIRVIFDKARDKARGGNPVVVFFDEMEALFRTRGSGLSSDVETTIVPQLLAEIDGVEKLDNVLVIGASNREDMIDPAILRPGRLDVKIKIGRPDAQAAREIFAQYLSPDLPIRADALAEAGGDAGAAVNAMIRQAVDRLYGAPHSEQFARIASGAVIRNTVDRAKKSAIKAYIDGGEHGLSWDGLRQACDEELRENADLGGTEEER